MTPVTIQCYCDNDVCAEWAAWTLGGKDYCEEHINKTLKPALVALCRERPADPVTWLANYLIETKPCNPAEEPGSEEARQEAAEMARLEALAEKLADEKERQRDVQ